MHYCTAGWMEEVYLGRLRQWVGRGEEGSLPLPAFGLLGSAGRSAISSRPPAPPSSCLLITERRWCVNTPAPYSVGKNPKPVLHHLPVPRGTGPRHPLWALFSKPLLASSVSHCPPPPPSVFLGVTSHLNYLSSSPDLFPQKTRLVQFIRSVVSDSLQPREPQHTRPPCPSPSPGVHSNSRPSSR